jgi:hypothetical protein
MTLNNVSAAANSSYFEAASPALDTSFTSVGERLAVLVLNTEQQQKDADRQNLELARADYAKHLGEEVSALREQADNTLWGAVFEGGAAIASGALSAAGACVSTKPTWESMASKNIDRLAGPLAKWVAHSDGGAAAEAASGAAKQATWEIDDSKTALHDADERQSKALDISSKLNDADAATTRAVLSNMA